MENILLEEKLQEIQDLFPISKEEKALSDTEANNLREEPGVKKIYNYGKSYYGTATLELLYNNWTLVTYENAGTFLYKDGSGFAKAKAYVTRAYSLMQLMGGP